MSIALIGTRGVPARYGGFETCVEEVGKRLSAKGHRVSVYCRSSKTEPPIKLYEGMQLISLPAIPRRSLETLSHTGLSVGHLLGHRTDVAIVFNAANSPFLPLIRAARIPVATHVDGLEWKRDKWGSLGKRYYRAAESLSVRWSDVLIADARGIQDYYSLEFGVHSQLITYGAPRVDGGFARLQELGLEPGAYHLVVARFEPENHVDLIVDGYSHSDARLPLVVVGSAPYANEYTKKIHRAANSHVSFLGGVWDQQLLDQLYGNAMSYIHGHSVGGTNPSLLRAVGAGTPTLAFDVSFNRDVLSDAGRYFSTAQELGRAIINLEVATDRPALSAAVFGRAAKYDWDEVADAYESLCRGLADGSLRQKKRKGLGIRRVKT